MKLVIVTPDFPPSTIANAMRPSLLAREMHAKGHHIEVFTRDHSAQNSVSQCDQEDPPSYEVKRLSDPVHAWRKKFGGIRLIRLLLARMWPDPQLFWVIKVARCLKAGNEKATVVATVNPVSMLFLRILAPGERFYFIFDYLESQTPFRKIVPYDLLFHRMLSRALAFLEKYALKRANKVVFTSSENLDTYVKEGLCPRDRAAYVPQYCDPNPHAAVSLACDDKMVISYIGYFNRDRSPETFLLGLRAFLDQEPTAKEHITFNCYGNGLGLHTHLLSELSLDGCINCHDPIQYSEVLEVSAKSHVLLLVTSPKHNLFFPSKVAEYLSARRPILALVPPKSDVSETLKKYNQSGWTCFHDDTAAVTESLILAWDDFRRGNLGEILPPCHSFESPNFTTTWDDLICGRV